MEDTEFKSRVINTFKTMKYELDSKLEELVIPVKKEGNIIGYLRPIPAELKGIAQYDAELISKWRNKYRENFLTWQTYTPEGVKQWLQEQISKREDTIIFMVQKSLLTPPIGQISLTNFNFKEKACDINQFKGENNCMILYQFAGPNLISWAYSHLKINKVWARILSSNSHTLMWARKVGFQFIKKVPLRKIESNNKITWVEEDEFPDSNAQLYLYYLEISSPEQLTLYKKL